MRDKVPIGVMIQVNRDPARYVIYGLALVVGWEDGYFFLEGFSADGHSHGHGPEAEIEMLTKEYHATSSDAGTFDPSSVLDGRRKIVTSIVQRQGQSEFRRRLLDIYEGCCVISGCKVAQVLEAAHIVPYLGPQTNHFSNGLLLRADLHTLFDLGLIAIDTTTMTVIVSPKLERSPYYEFQGEKLYLPRIEIGVPSKEALDAHRKWAGL